MHATLAITSSLAASIFIGFVLADNLFAGFSPKKYAILSAFAPDGCGKPPSTWSWFMEPVFTAKLNASSTFGPSGGSNGILNFFHKK